MANSSSDEAFELIGALILIGIVSAIIAVAAVAVASALISVGAVFGGSVSFNNYVQSFVKNVKPE